MALMTLSISFALIAGPLVQVHVQTAAFMRQMAVPLAMLALVLLVAIRHEKKWRQTVGQLADVLENVRGGRLPSEQIARLLDGLADKGELTRLAAEVERIVADASEAQQRARRQVAEADRRVNTTTNALEKEIGQLKHQAGRDGLTGLGNRRSLDETLPRFVKTARANMSQLSVIMIDVDRFKELNDTLGHAAGDRMLKEFARLLRGTVRENDAAFRYGGDEFVLLLADVGIDQARATAERLMRLGDDLARPLRGLAHPPGLSCGVSSLSQLPAAACGEDLLKAADADAYRIKRQRRTLRRAA
ncbi:MAG: GGDEF domain-containing protein [Planctomycetota bacterium]